MRSLRIRIVHNERAGAHNTARFSAVLNRLQSHGHTCEILTTRKAGDAASFVGSANTAGIDLVVIAGGDGTINDALQGISSNTPPLGLLPLGTANVLAHEIGMGTDPDEIATCLMACNTLDVRPGVVNGRRFIMMTSVGLDAQVVSDMPRTLKKRLGKLAYLVQGLQTLARYAPPQIEVQIDGTATRAATIIVNRGQRYGGRFVLASNARLSDPRFVASIVPDVGRLALFARFLAIPLGLVNRLSLVQQIAGTQIEITGPQGHPVQADGDIIAQLPVRVTLDDLVIKLCVPREP